MRSAKCNSIAAVTTQPALISPNDKATELARRQTVAVINSQWSLHTVHFRVTMLQVSLIATICMTVTLSPFSLSLSHIKCGGRLFSSIETPHCTLTTILAPTSVAPHATHNWWRDPNINQIELWRNACLYRQGSQPLVGHILSLITLSLSIESSSVCSQLLIAPVG